jgi:protein-S-isoprenylcysteine O-methyltransferase Ste14
MLGNASKAGSFLGGIRRLVGVGLHLLLLGLLLEGSTLVARQWISFPISLTLGKQVFLTGLCTTACLLGVTWFNRSLDLIRVHLLNGENELITAGPFAFVRHPLYATLLITVPPLAIIWLSDLLFLFPWVLIFVGAHGLVRLEERGLLETFGEDYERYRKCVPALIPYKGAVGQRYHEGFLGEGNKAKAELSRFDKRAQHYEVKTERNGEDSR